MMKLAPLQKPPLGSTINRGHLLAQGLVGCWLFNEGSGDRVWDYSGNGNHGTCMNMSPQSSTSGWGPGPHGGALAFAFAGNNYVNCGNGPSFNFGANNFSIGFYINPTWNQIWHSLVVKRTDYLTNNDWGLWYNSTPNIQFIYGSNVSVALGTAPASGVWTRIDIVRLGNTLTMYKNAIAGTPQALTATLGISVNNAYIGAGNNPNGSHYYNGLFSNVSIYNRALSAEEIAYLYAFPYCMFEDEGFPAWMVPPAASQYYYRHLLAGGR